MKYVMDIKNDKGIPFLNITVENEQILIGAYEGGEIKRKLFYLNKEKTTSLVKALTAVLTLID